RHGQPPVLGAPPVPDPELALDAARFWLIDEIRENIEAFARHQPLLIALDDVQWADELTVLALNTLIPAVATVPVCWLLARRTGARRTAALDWPALEHARRLRLEPLARPAVSQLCTHLLGALPDPNLLALIDRGGGNPFLIEELLNALRGEERIQLSAGTATITGGELPADFVAAVDRRLGDHSPAARQVLDAGAILGRPFTVHEVAALTGLPVPEAIGAAREGVSAGVLVEVDDDLGFRHDLLREAVYRALSRATRRALHREAVRVLQGEGRPAAEVAGHVTRYARKGDLAALGQLRDAVKEVMSVAPGVAADLLSKILDLTPVPHGDRPDLIADRIRMLAAAGRLAEALAASEAALKENLDPAAEAAILVGLSETLKHSGRDSVVVHQAERALERPGVPPAMRARLHAVQAHGLLYTSDLAAAEPAARAAMDLGDAAGDSSAVVFGGAARSVVARWRGQLTQSVALARAAVQRADEAGGDARLRHPRAWLGRALISVDQFDEAQAVLAQGKRETQELGTAWSLPVIHGYQAQLLLATGRLEEAVVEAESGLRVATQLEAWALSELLVSIRIWLAVSQRQMAEAQAYLRRSQRRSRRLSAQPSRGWAFVQDGRGRPEEAVTAFLSRYDRLAEEPGLLTEEPLGAAYLVRLALRAGRPD
ncbi:MAG: hypothetical protein J2P15_22455, partial [Micromonosporaceae bacterium]|nr:hypothetical protein [Micromonosporaceae bacterium]